MFGLEHTQLLMIVTASVFMTTVQTLLCTPAEQFQPHNITLKRAGDWNVWLKDNAPIVKCINTACAAVFNISGYTAIASSQTSTLVILNVTRESAGIYVCNSEIQTSCDLNVYDPVKTDEEKNGYPGPNVISIVAGNIAAVVMVIASIFMFIFFWRRKKRKVNLHAESGDTEVEVVNSDLYNVSRPTPDAAEIISNPYEDVSSGEKSQTKPPTAQKPKPVAKPEPQSREQEGKQATNTAPDQTYAMVVKL